MSASLTPPQEAYASLPEPAPTLAAAPTVPSACQLRLTTDLAVIHPLPPIIGPGDCGALDVVRLDTIVLPDAATVAVSPPATLRCEMAEAVVHWVREAVAPAVRDLRSPLRGLENYDSFECRGRNRVVGAKVSEHGLANALDIKSLKLADGTVLGPTDAQVSHEFRDGLRQSACSRFMTVLRRLPRKPYPHRSGRASQRLQAVPMGCSRSAATERGGRGGGRAAAETASRFG
jgi:hypothetical protein